jgi:hypothetical protein
MRPKVVKKYSRFPVSYAHGLYRNNNNATFDLYLKHKFLQVQLLYQVGIVEGILLIPKRMLTLFLD